MDGDGRLDVLGAPNGAHAYGGGTYLVWRQTGALSFDAPVAFFGKPSYRIFDVDQDGDGDVFGPHTTRGRRFAGADDGFGRQYGSGSPGSGGVRPLLGFRGPLRPGSSTAALRVCRGVGGGQAFVRIGAGPAYARGGPLPGLVSLHRPPYLPLATVPLGGPSGAAGAGAGELSLTPFLAPLAGTHGWLQAFVLDPGAPGGVSATNGLELAFGN